MRLRALTRRPSHAVFVTLIATSSVSCRQSDGDGSSRANFNGKLLTGEVLASPVEVATEVDRIVATYDAAEQRLDDCLDEHGLADYVPATLEVEYLQPERRLWSAYESTLIHGYGIADGEGRSGISFDIQTHSSAAVDAALPTLMAGPCAQTFNGVDPGNMLYDFQTQALIDLEAHLATIGVDFVEADRGWQRCMDDQGHAFATSNEAGLALSKKFESLQSRSASPAEIEGFIELELSVATADMECRLQHFSPVIEEALARSPVPVSS